MYQLRAHLTNLNTAFTSRGVPGIQDAVNAFATTHELALGNMRFFANEGRASMQCNTAVLIPGDCRRLAGESGEGFTGPAKLSVLPLALVHMCTAANGDQQYYCQLRPSQSSDHCELILGAYGILLPAWKDEPYWTPLDHEHDNWVTFFQSIREAYATLTSHPEFQVISIDGYPSQQVSSLSLHLKFHYLVHFNVSLFSSSQNVDRAWKSSSV